MKFQINILYEDEAVVVADKPAGLLSIPDRFDPDKSCLVELLNRRYGKVFVVHRLDRETSGVICMAKTEEAHRALSLQFEKRSVEKIYLAIVQGIPHPEQGVIDQPIAAGQSQSGKMIVHRNGKEAVTHYRVLEKFRHMALVEADIKTGRTHQIRVHFQAIGHPLIVDSLYGGKEAFYLSTVKKNKYRLGKDQEERPLMSRATLHAGRLTFDHPLTGRRMTIEAPLPKDFAAVLNQLRKWDANPHKSQNNTIQ
jgi:23S rRNA pseudouridine1911/1915/1917 synthase